MRGDEIGQVDFVGARIGRHHDDDAVNVGPVAQSSHSRGDAGMGVVQSASRRAADFLRMPPLGRDIAGDGGIVGAEAAASLGIVPRAFTAAKARRVPLALRNDVYAEDAFHPARSFRRAPALFEHSPLSGGSRSKDFVRLCVLDGESFTLRRTQGLMSPRPPFEAALPKEELKLHFRISTFGRSPARGARAAVPPTYESRRPKHPMRHSISGFTWIDPISGALF